MITFIDGINVTKLSQLDQQLSISNKKIKMFFGLKIIDRPRVDVDPFDF